MSAPPIYIGGDNEGVDVDVDDLGAARTPPDLESQPEESQETRNGEASEPLLTDAANANGGPRSKVSWISEIVGALISGAIVVGFLAGHISMAIQSVKSGNNSTQTDGFAFLAVFVAVVPPLDRGNVCVMEGGKNRVAFVGSVHVSQSAGPAYDRRFLLGVAGYIVRGHKSRRMSRRVIGLGPTGNTSEFDMVLYWTYLAFSKLPLFCY